MASPTTREQWEAILRQYNLCDAKLTQHLFNQIWLDNFQSPEEPKVSDQSSTTQTQEGPSLGLLIKLLKMTTSSTDAEALVAIRKANDQLKRHFGGDWEALLRGKVTVIADPFDKFPLDKMDTGDKPSFRPTAPPRPNAPPPPPPPRAKPRPTVKRTSPPFWAGATASPPPPPPPPPKQRQKGPSGGSIRTNLFSGSCVFCSNNVPVQGGYAIKDTSWNTKTYGWEVVCDSCYDNNGKPKPYAAPPSQPSSNTSSLA